MSRAVTEPRPPRTRKAPSDPEQAALDAALAPVVEAIMDMAQTRAQAIRADAAAATRAELARVHVEAERILDDARADAAAAAAATAASQLTMARREARETVLAARRRAYETLREVAVATLVQRSATPEGRQLAARLQTLVCERVGTSASVHAGGPGNLGVVAESGNRRAEVGPAGLVDQAVESLGTEIEALWA